MNKLLLLILIPFFLNAQEKKNSEIINPSGEWYFGAEIGPNIVKSYTLGERNTFLQGGILVEYYIGKHWSLTGRIKYFKIGGSYNQPEEYIGGFGSGSSIGSSYFGGGYKIESSYGYFKGEVITLPLNIKWEFRLWKNLSGQFNIGANYNIETKIEYKYSQSVNSEFEKKYTSLNVGYGINYFISKKIGVFFNFETYQGISRRQKDAANSNSLLNFGVKYNFKNEKR